MTIDIYDILVEDVGAQKHFTGEISYRDTVYQGDKLSFITPFEISGTLTKDRDCLYLTVDACGEIQMPCSRCTKMFVHKVDLSFTEKICDIDDLVDGEELDIYTYQGNKIKLDRIIYEQIILDIPIKRLCTTNCKGLCPKCGIDLNEEGCSCDRDDDIDIRLLELKKLLPSKDEEV